MHIASDQGDAAAVGRLDEPSRAKSYRAVIRVAVALANTGARREAAGRLEAAAAKLRALLVNQPENSSAWRQLGRFKALLGDPEEALRCALKGVALVPVARDIWQGPDADEALAFVYA